MARRSCGTNGRNSALVMCASLVMLATRMSALLLAYMRCRMWPGWTRSNAPWHMITFFWRGGRPMVASKSSRVLILRRKSLWTEGDDIGLSSFGKHGEPGLGGRLDRNGVPNGSVTPVLDIIEHQGDPLIEAYFSLPAEVAANLGGVRPRAIGFARPFRYVGNWPVQQFDWVVDGLRVARAEVVDLVRVIGFSSHEKRASHVGYVNEIPRLRAVADHGEGFARELLSEEHAKHRAISTGGSRTKAVGIEDANRIDGKPVHLAPMENSLLTLIFA